MTAPQMYDAVPATLAPDEQQRLLHHERTIERGLQTFYDVGAALAAIREERLYRAHYATFEEYCQQRWGMTRMRANHLIAAAEVMNNVNHGLQTPANERQARPLASLPPEQQVEAWQQAVETAPHGKVTGAHVERVVQAMRQPVDDAPQLEDEPLSAYEQGLAETQVTTRPSDTAVTDVPQQHRHSMAVHFSSTSAEWFTPVHVLDLVREVLGDIDLDPASCMRAQQQVQAGAWCGLDHPDPDWRDGLAREWPGRIWLNPPYGTVIETWAHRLIHQYDLDITSEAITLLPARTDTEWFQPLFAHPICFVQGRLRFSGASTGAPFPSALVYFGSNTRRFSGVFSQIGKVVAGVSL